MKKIIKQKTTFIVSFIFTICLILASCSSNELEIEEQTVTDFTAEEVPMGKCNDKPYKWLQDKYGTNNVNWKLQYPSGSSAKTAYRWKDPSPYFKDISSSRFEMVGSTCSKARMRFRVDGDDPTSGNSPNPRCELRERTKKRSGHNQDKDAGWSTGRSDNKELIFKAKVTAAPSSSGSSLVVAQLHSGGKDGSDTATIKVKKSGSKYKLLFTGGGISGDITLDSDYKVNSEIFDITLRVKKNKVSVKYNGSWKSTKWIASDYRTSTTYYKAGAYLLSADDDEQGKVEFYSVKLNKYEDF